MEDESNNSDMTLPKANLAQLNDDVSSLSRLTVLPRMERDVIIKPKTDAYRTA